MSNNTQADRPTSIPFNCGGIENRDDQLIRTSDQLCALLQTMVGEGFENFSAYSAEIQQNVIWLAADLADQLRVVARQPAEVPHG